MTRSHISKRPNSRGRGRLPSDGQTAGVYRQGHAGHRARCAAVAPATGNAVAALTDARVRSFADVAGSDAGGDARYVIDLPASTINDTPVTKDDSAHDRNKIG